MKHSRSILVILSGLLLWIPASYGVSASRYAFLSIQQRPSTSSALSTQIFELRGGASKKKTSRSKKSSKTATGTKKVGAMEAEDKSFLATTFQNYKKILPLTRIYITAVATATILGLALGEELTQGLLALDPIRILYGMELWRPFTASSFLGPLSIRWLMNGYYLFEYGSSLERAYGTAQHSIFLLTQLILLSITSALVGQPFFADSMITSMLHVLSRSMPHQKVKWLIFTVPYWSLPYGLMISDVLQAQSAAAAMPHVLGILTGHFYYFHKNIWPKLPQGEDWLVAPEFVSNRLDPDSTANAVAGKKSISKALKSRKKSKGRKLGSK